MDITSPSDLVRKDQGEGPRFDPWLRQRLFFYAVLVGMGWQHCMGMLGNGHEMVWDGAGTI